MTENDLEQACIEWFRELGWEYSHGETISPGGFAPERAHYNEVILAPRFRSALESLNPDLPVSAIDDAEKRVKQFAGQSLIEANRDLYVWLRDGIPVDIEDDGHRRQVAVAVFDWTDITRNDWLIVNQFTVKGSKTVRPDMVAFVNGLPLAVIELKNPADEKADVFAAFNQIQNYKNEIPQLFEPNVVCIISDGTVARVGSLSADQERFMPWRVADGIAAPDQHLELEVLVKGLFERADLPKISAPFHRLPDHGRRYVQGHRWLSPISWSAEGRRSGAGLDPAPTRWKRRRDVVYSRFR